MSAPGLAVLVDPEAERAAVGAVLAAPARAAELLQGLCAEDLTSTRARVVLEAARAVAAEGIPPDPVAVVAWLREHGRLEEAGGPLFVRDLAADVPVPGPHHARRVADLARRRRRAERLREAIAALERGDEAMAEAAIAMAGGEEEEAGPSSGEPFSTPAPELLRGIEGENDAPRFLVEHLWALEGVGFLAGGAKSLKTWTMLELALSVATGVPAFGRFEPTAQGPVLIVQEESPTPDFARRLRWLAAGHGLDPDALQELHVASQRGLRLDEPASLARLEAELERTGAIFCCLDPLVRMHSADEDRRREMGPVLDAIRGLQARCGCAVAVVHHMSKPRGDRELRPGERMRGTGDLHALLDSALYFDARPSTGLVAVTVEHRDAAAPDPFLIHLEVNEDQGTARLVAEHGTLAEVAAIEALPAVEQALRAAAGGMTAAEVQQATRLRRQTVYEALRRLEDAGRVRQEDGRREDRRGRSRPVQVWSRI